MEENVGKEVDKEVRPGPEGFEMSDVSFVQPSSRFDLLIANNLMSDF